MHDEFDSLAVGLTKPATKLGVPFNAFFMSILAVMLAGMMFQAMSGVSGIGVASFFLMVWAVIYLFMFFKTSHDVFGLNIFWINLIYFKPNQSRSHWGNTDSYLP